MAETYREVDKHLSDLPLGSHDLIDIVKRIRGITSQKHRTQVLLSKQVTTSDYLKKCAVDENGDRYNLNKVKVDITYQRSLRLKKIFEHLDTQDIFSGEELGFDTMLAGSVDFAIRPNNDIYVWDGFRRCILAMLKGLVNIPANVERHPDEWKKDITKCRKKEAFCFSQRNGTSERMKPEELFKAGVAEGNKIYLEVKDALAKCELDVLRVLLGNTKLGGYKEFETVVLETPFNDADYTTLEYMIEASDIIRNAFGSNVNEVSGHLLTGMACFLFHNAESQEESTDYYIEPDDLYEQFEDYVNNKKGTQSNLTKDRIHSISRQSVAWQIATKVYGMKKTAASEMMKISDDQAEQLVATR